jgi:hypothetical protein
MQPRPPVHGDKVIAPNATGSTLCEGSTWETKDGGRRVRGAGPCSLNTFYLPDLFEILRQKERWIRVAEMPGKAWIVATVVTMWASAACLADDLTGQPRVIDGDTMAVASRHVRLQGIDAPETDQVCLDAQGERWTCGITARERLSSHIAGRAVTCASRGEDRFGRTLATCSADGENLNA